MEYDFRKIEQQWQNAWKESGAYKVSNQSAKPKYYVLDMFPYPSGAGLHVGHPLGYIASDIYSRYKRLKGFNVLHPMGFDSFGLPAEQYALETGQHPATTTKKNIATFKAQLDKIGFCYDWDREVRTSDPQYYKWTQWIFLQLFNSYFCNTQKKARPIADLIKKYETKGNKDFTPEQWNTFTKKEQEDILMNRRLAFSKYGEVNWCEALGTVLANDEVVNGVSERGGHPVEKKKMRQWYLRITDYADRLLEGLETVDFSDSMKEMQRNWIGKSEGAEIEFEVKSSESGDTDSKFPTNNSRLKVYTTRPDTIFGVDFMVVAPEHELVSAITTAEQQVAIDEYLHYVKSRSERERLSEAKTITGCFTGAFAINPFDGREIPIWIAEYVLAGYGTGAIMAVPCGDQRDYTFAKHFNIPITNIIGHHFNSEEANPTKEATLENSGFLNGLLMKDAMGVAVNKIEELSIGKRKVNYRMRDAGFSRQRYWGEPFPIVWNSETPFALTEDKLPLKLPHVDSYSHGPEGEGPLANISEWLNTQEGRRETSTMPGYAGSSWYFLRYMDPKNPDTFCDRKASDYWNQVDLYIGGTEHAVGHLLYSRMWTKVLFDLGLIGYDEPFKKLLNQGMIQGSSRFVYRYIWKVNYDKGKAKEYFLSIEENLDADKIRQRLVNRFINDIANCPVFISKTHLDFLNTNKGSREGFLNNVQKILVERLQERKSELLHVGVYSEDYEFEISVNELHVDVNIVDGIELDIEAFRNWKPEYKNAVIVCEDGEVSFPLSLGEGLGVRSNGKYICGVETEKMSKSKYNTVNPDELCDKYGADTFRMYEMFLGPVEASKPWDTKGIEGVHRFLRKLWRLFNDDIKGPIWTTATPSPQGRVGEGPSDAELKVLHRTIKKIEEDTERFSFNTAVSTFMICVNELADLKCHKKEILEPLLILLAPYAPHIAEELFQQLNAAKAPSTGGDLGEAEGSVLDATYPKFNPALLVESTKEYPVSINGKLRTNMELALDLDQTAVEALVLQNEIVQKWLEGKAPKKIIFVKNKMINVVI